MGCSFPVSGEGVTQLCFRIFTNVEAVTSLSANVELGKAATPNL